MRFFSNFRILFKARSNVQSQFLAYMEMPFDRGLT